ncbi:MAG: molybdopterin molybdotransferase MoeA, partial [Erysipelotrichaceae bacterium]|nr:molybdopterin molybdotransferase MoeA [Erysipelotrichaceae bacterium]
MLSVKTPEEVYETIEDAFSAGPLKIENVSLEDAVGRVLSDPVKAVEYVPGFDRSTVDGYAVWAADTFGCSETLPALLQLKGEVLMGKKTDTMLQKGECMYVPTGGAIPEGADAAVMIEYTEDYGDGTIGILKSAAPGSNLIYKGDDVYPGKEVLSAGRKLTAGDIGSLAALGISVIGVAARPVIGIISTGDELVPIETVPEKGQVRDVNSAMLSAIVKDSGGESILYGIVADDERSLKETLDKALLE